MNARELMERNIERWNAHDEKGWSGLFADNATLAGPGGLRGSGAEIVTMFYGLWQQSFPDNQVRIVRVVADGGQVVNEAVFEGTHTATLSAPGGDVPPTGRSVSVPFVNVCEVSGDRFIDFTLYFDQLELMTQLGLGAPMG
jgi:predicted ester cyclase